MGSDVLKINLGKAMTDADNDNDETGRKPLSPAALRALEEAEARRKAAEAQSLPPEVGGRGGADPARFGDWEINGRAIDF
jgi:hypothetical protein